MRVDSNDVVRLVRLKITNANGIPAKAKLEAPIGQEVWQAELGPNKSITVDFTLEAVPSIQVSADYGPDHGTYARSLLLNSGLWVEKVDALAAIGSLHIRASVSSTPAAF
jgi:hypothetical protein